MSHLHRQRDIIPGATSMTEKELHKLKREDLLRLLLAQSREVTRLKTEAEEREAELASLHETNERLKEKLNEKDAHQNI